MSHRETIVLCAREVTTCGSSGFRVGVRDWSWAFTAAPIGSRVHTAFGKNPWEVEDLGAGGPDRARTSRSVSFFVGAVSGSARARRPIPPPIRKPEGPKLPDNARLPREEVLRRSEGSEFAG
jgi:hypothetical protein